jgi:hypothetical protein
MVALRQQERYAPDRTTPSRSHPHLRIVDADVLALVRRDTLPEHADYRDTGCELSASCLRCPLARCKHDDPPGGARRLVTNARDREIALLRRRHHAPIDMLAGAYGLSRRTIFRILRRHRE